MNRHACRRAMQEQGAVDDRYLQSVQATLESSWWRRVASQVPEQQEISRKRLLLDELKACSRTRNLEKGERLHDQAVKTGTDSCIYVATALVNMYSKCGNMVRARQVFDAIKHPNVVSWTALMMGYAEKGEGSTALELLVRMRSQGCAPNSLTFVAALKACISFALKEDPAKCLERGRRLHSEIGHHSDLFVQSALVGMYAKGASMIEARRVFDGIEHPDVVSWTALILGYVDSGEGSVALDLFESMKSRGCAADSLTFVAALKACASLAANRDGIGKAECLERGRRIHSAAGSNLDIYVQNTLIDMYSKCGSMVDARQIFDAMEKPSVVSWNALVWGYAENGEGAVALSLFARMKSRGFSPNSATFVAALKACTSLGDLESGRKVHSEIGTEVDTILLNSLVHFYSKCGSVLEARKAFDSYPESRNLKTWNALLAGYSRLGSQKAVFELFDAMQDAGFQPDGVTFSCLLAFCSHAGLVEKASELFEAMSTAYGITPTVEHYNCMVDILARSNKLDDAMALLQSMPCGADAITWMTILGAKST